MKLSIFSICFILLFTACSQDDPPLPPAVTSTIGNFSVSVQDRLANSAKIKWTKPAYNGSTTINYKIYISSSLVAQSLIDTNYVVNNLLPGQTYNGRVVSYTSPVDSSSANFSISVFQSNVNVPTITLETTKFILLSMRENDLSVSLYCYNPDKTLRWSKRNLGNIPTNYAAYSNGIIYFSVSTFDYTTNNASSNFYAINAVTGNYVWSQLNSSIIKDNLVATNNIIYASTNSANVNSIAAYSTSTGSLLWSLPISGTYAIGGFFLDGSKLYFLARATNLQQLYIKCLDINTQIEQWSKLINSGSPSKIYMLNGILFLTCGGELFAYDKITGRVVWSKPGVDSNHPVAGNNLVYKLETDQGLYAYNYLNGNTVWQWNSVGSFFIGGQPYISGENVFLLGLDNFYFLSAYNGSSGLNYYEKSLPFTYTEHMVVGSDIYTLKRQSMNTGIPASQIVIFHTVSGSPKDSFSIPNGESYQPIGIVNSNDQLVYPN